MPPLRVDVWSDLACPWCAVGKRRLEAALGRLGAPVEVVWRSFELDPGAPRMQPGEITYAERLARKYGTSVAEADGMIRRMTDVAAGEGLAFRFDRARPGNTFDAHRLLHLARERGAQDALKERLFRAYLSEGEALGDPAALARLAPEAGLARDEVERVLASDAYAEAVRADEAEARRLGIHAVPFFVLAGRWGVSGAQPADVLLQALRTAGAAPPADGPACGPEGC